MQTDGGVNVTHLFKSKLVQDHKLMKDPATTVFGIKPAYTHLVAYRGLKEPLLSDVNSPHLNDGTLDNVVNKVNLRQKADLAHEIRLAANSNFEG